MEKLIKLIVELAIRLSADSPKLFVKLQWIAGIISGVLTLVLILNEIFLLGMGNVILYGTMNLPTFLGLINGMFLGILGVSKLTVADHTLLENIEPKKD